MFKRRALFRGVWTGGLFARRAGCVVVRKLLRQIRKRTTADARSADARSLSCLCGENVKLRNGLTLSCRSTISKLSHFEVDGISVNRD
jgi:hypothetical protein